MKKRTIGVIGHIDHGKTALAAAILAGERGVIITGERHSNKDDILNTKILEPTISTSPIYTLHSHGMHYETPAVEVEHGCRKPLRKKQILKRKRQKKKAKLSRKRNKN